ncbi:hypothetical protein [Natroniella sp. ANB-PHB2]|uniref:hypothetical protein n=1 Tax=Natroniella sp. ANB-PHB2 TaxID=3384444 RepID=UPI0038D3A8FA
MLSKKNLVLIILLLLIPVAARRIKIGINILPASYYARSLEGTGTAEDPFIINDFEGLERLSDKYFWNQDYKLEAYYKLSADIDASATRKNYKEGKGWEPIGSEEGKFRGVFDGNGYKIKNLYINRKNEDYIGLFAFSTGTIKNLEMVNVKFEGDTKVGGLIGGSNTGITSEGEGKVINSSVEGTVKGNAVVGGGRNTWL